MEREAVLSAVPVERKTPVRERPKLEPAMAFIDAILEAEKKSHFSYLEALPEAEVEERERNTVARRIREAHFPKLKAPE